jgi:hypothetical protein
MSATLLCVVSTHPGANLMSVDPPIPDEIAATRSRPLILKTKSGEDVREGLMAMGRAIGLLPEQTHKLEAKACEIAK